MSLDRLVVVVAPDARDGAWAAAAGPLNRWMRGQHAASLPTVPDPHGFDYVRRGEDVVIRHHGRVATTLRGARAQAFLDQLSDQDPQELMARLTGNYRRGNERQARSHPRNRKA